MDPRDLKTSSIYLNNLLAARGIIRGLPIDFAKPTKDSENPPRILNLVHSLITRQDVCQSAPCQSWGAASLAGQSRLEQCY